MDSYKRLIFGLVVRDRGELGCRCAAVVGNDGDMNAMERVLLNCTDNGELSV